MSRLDSLPIWQEILTNSLWVMNCLWWRSREKQGPLKSCPLSHYDAMLCLTFRIRGNSTPCEESKWLYHCCFYFIFNISYCRRDLAKSPLLIIVSSAFKWVGKESGLFMTVHLGCRLQKVYAVIYLLGCFVLCGPLSGIKRFEDCAGRLYDTWERWICTL